MAHGFLSDYIAPLSVSFDNETSDDCTLVKVHGANRHDILLKMVQVLSDLNLVIVKCNIKSDGDWFLNVFHVTDCHGHKTRDETLIQYIQQSLNVAQRKNGPPGPTQVKISHGNIVNVGHFASDCTALLITSNDHPKIFSEVTAVLFELSYTIDSGELWTHNGRMACILYLKEHGTGKAITEQASYFYLGQHISTVVGVYHSDVKFWKVQLLCPNVCQIHTGRLLHQLMEEYKEYEIGSLSLPVEDDLSSLTTIKKAKGRIGGAGESSKVVGQAPQVSIESWKKKDYLVVTMRSSVRPKLIFDTLCILTDLDYDIFQGSVSSYGSVATTIKKAKGRIGGAGESSNVVGQAPQVSIESWKKKDYLVVTMRSSVRPKLIFDTLCILTDLDYDIFQGSVSSYGSVAIQEYFVRRKNGCSVLNEMEKKSLIQSLVTAIDRRMSQGLKMEVRTLDRLGLLSKVSRVLRKNGLSLKKAEFAKEGYLAVGTFYITDASTTDDVDNIDQQRLEAVRNEFNNCIFFLKKSNSNISSSARGRWGLFSAFYSLGKCLWSQIKRFFSNFSFIR